MNITFVVDATILLNYISFSFCEQYIKPPFHYMYLGLGFTSFPTITFCKHLLQFVELVGWLFRV